MTESKQRDVAMRQAVRELAFKMRFEGTFRRELVGLFRRLNSDFQISLAASRRTPPAENYATAFDTVLENHYARVQRAFRGRIFERNGGKFLVLWENKQTEEEEQLEVLIGLALLRWRQNTAGRKARLITTTNEAEMQEAVAQARRALEATGDPNPDDRTLARAAATILARRNRARIERIIQTETQDAAESTKQIEATALAGATPFILQNESDAPPPVPSEREVSKTWRTMRDNDVRPTHVATDRTRLDNDGVFVVGISRLRFPGDAFLGAEIKEVANCRCFADYEFRE